MKGHDYDFLPEVIRTKLRQSMGLVTNDLVEETTLAVHDLFGQDGERQEMPLKLPIQRLVARLSSRVFLGERLCCDERWLQIAKDFTIDAFIASRVLRVVPPLLRPVLHWVIPQCKKLRKDYSDAQKLIGPEIESRKDHAPAALAAGKKPPKVADAIGWMYGAARESQETVNYVDLQLRLTLAAVHTTLESLSTTLLDIMAHPEILEPLRREIVEVVGQLGWSKQALYKPRLMDSLLRESQRCHEMNYVSMQRMAIRDLTLSNGSVIPAGARFVVARKTRDPNLFKDPYTFDPYRFLRLREESDNNGQPTTSQHVSLSGQIPLNELKIALAHLLLKYDWERVEDSPAYFRFETNESVSPACKVRFRRRKEEISLELDNTASEVRLFN